jgi:uncharacterized protein
MLAILDAGPLYAAIDQNEYNHERAAQVIQRADIDLVVPILVVTEVLYFVNQRLGADVEARFLASLVDFDVRTPHPEDWPRISELVSIYRDFPLGGVDASVIALAELHRPDHHPRSTPLPRRPSSPR